MNQPPTAATQPEVPALPENDPRYTSGPDAGPLLRGLLGGGAGAAALLALDAILGSGPGGVGPRSAFPSLAASAAGASDSGTGAAVILVGGAATGLCYAYGRFRRFVPGRDWGAGIIWGVLLFVLTSPFVLPAAIAPAGAEATEVRSAFAWAAFLLLEWFLGLAVYGLVLAVVNPKTVRARDLTLVGLALLLTACAQDPGTPTPWRPAVTGAGDPELPARVSSALEGSAIYAGYCVECHGREGEGDSRAARLFDRPPPDFTDPAYMSEQQPAYYFRAVKVGVPGTGMLRWDHVLDDDDVWDVVFYIWSLGAEEGALALGQATFATACAECHGTRSDEPAVGEPTGAPALAVAELARQSRSSLAASTVERHPEIAGELGDAELAGVVEAIFAQLFEPITPLE